MNANKVTAIKLTTETVRVKDTPDGSILRFMGDYYIKVSFQSNSARIGAIALADGGYLTPEAEVQVVTKGAIIEIVVGGVEW